MVPARLVPAWLARFGRPRIDPVAPPAFRALHAFSDDPDSLFSAAIRRLSDALRLNAAAGRSKIVLITSDHDGAGKSTIAVNLVRAACERGERALLIDGNPDSPVLSQLVASDAEPCLIQLAGTARLCFTVDAGSGRSFRLVPMFEDEDEAVRELRDRGATSIAGIKGHFDVVVIDGPTIGADDTASLVAEAVDQVVLVMPPTAHRDMVADAIGRLRVPTWKFRGTVLSKVENRRIAA